MIAAHSGVGLVAQSGAGAASTVAAPVPPLPYESTAARSPRILALRADVEAGVAGAVTRFWDASAREGTPLVEPIPGTDAFQLATFLWRGSDTTLSVLLDRGESIVQQQPVRQLLARVPGTDVWFKTLRLPRASRFTYLLSENDPLGVMPPGSWTRQLQLDPLNPRVETPPGRVSRSFAELPGAPPQPWRIKRSDVPVLTMVKERFTSKVLGNERDLLVYTPPAYRTTGPRYPTVYLTDAGDESGTFAAATIENLIHEKRIPPVVVVRIANVPDGRTRELSCNRDFAKFLTTELVPSIRSRFHVSTDPSQTLLGGESLGGLTAACTGLDHSGTFGQLLVHSGSFWWEPTGAEDAEPNWVAREVLRRPRVPVRVFMTAGLFELDLTGRGGSILLPSRQLRDILRAKGYDVHYSEFAGAHQGVNWRGTLADGLIALLGRQR